jgi:hypothetical protein
MPSNDRGELPPISGRPLRDDRPDDCMSLSIRLIEPLSDCPRLELRMEREASLAPLPLNDRACDEKERSEAPPSPRLNDEPAPPPAPPLYTRDPPPPLYDRENERSESPPPLKEERPPPPLNDERPPPPPPPPPLNDERPPPPPPPRLPPPPPLNDERPPPPPPPPPFPLRASASPAANENTNAAITVNRANHEENIEPKPPSAVDMSSSAGLLQLYAHQQTTPASQRNDDVSGDDRHASIVVADPNRLKRNVATRGGVSAPDCAGTCQRFQPARRPIKVDSQSRP